MKLFVNTIGESEDLLCVRSYDEAREIRKIFLSCLVSHKRIMSKEQIKLLCIESLCAGINDICYCVECGHGKNKYISSKKTP